MFLEVCRINNQGQFIGEKFLVNGFKIESVQPLYDKHRNLLQHKLYLDTFITRQSENSYVGRFFYAATNLEDLEELVGYELPPIRNNI